MLIMTTDEKHLGIRVTVLLNQHGSEKRVELSIVAPVNESAAQITRQEAKRVAHALLLAADGIEP